MSQGVPFLSSVSWYPYVTVFGSFREEISVRHPLKGIELAWLKLRKPRFPDPDVAKQLEIVLHENQYPSLREHSCLDVNDPADATLFLAAIQICHEAYNVHFDNASQPFKDLSQEVRNQFKGVIPANINTFFQ